MTVHVQHCGTVENTFDLSFVVAKCTQPDLPYKFKFLDGAWAFRSKQLLGKHFCDTFSGLGIVSKQKRGQSYCARIYVANTRKR